jgi:branched-chain amino acid transport system permease protein
MGLAVLEIATILGLAGLYAVAATGYTLIHGVTRQFHLALGAFYTIGAFVALMATLSLEMLGLPMAAALIAGAMAAGFLVPAVGGALSWRLTLPAPTARGNPTAPLVTTIGLWIVLSEAVRLLQGPRSRFVDPPVEGTLTLYVGGDFDAIISAGHALVVPLAFGAVAAVGLVVARSRWGRAYRAAADDPAAAELMGIRVSAVIGWTCAIGCGLAGLAGVFATIRYGAVWHFMGFVFGLKALTAAVIGGIGSVRGAAIGALVVATVEVVWAVHVSGAYRDVVVFALLVLALIFRPDGLIDRGMAEALPGAGAARR